MLCLLVPPVSTYIDAAPIVSVIANRPQNLSCHSDGGKPAPNITWSTGGNYIIQAVTSTVVTQSDGKLQNTTSWLTITPQKTDQGRVYECDAKNQAIITVLSSTAQLSVLCK